MVLKVFCCFAQALARDGFKWTRGASDLFNGKRNKLSKSCSVITVDHDDGRAANATS